MELKNVITEMKCTLERLSSILDQAEDSANLKKGQLRLFSLRNRNKKEKKRRKINRASRPVKHHEVYQHIHSGIPKRGGER